MAMSIALIVIFIVLIVCGGYFGGAETAFTAMNKIKIKAMAEDGDKRARSAMYISNNFERALTTLLIGNNITHIGAGAVATTLVLKLWNNGEGIFGNISQDTASFLYGTVIATLIVFLFAEMIPKSHANDRSETLALKYATSLRVLMKVFYPLVVFFGWITTFVSRLFSAPPEPSITEDELYDIIETAEAEGVVDEKQSDMLRSALDFSDTMASDVMTMREDITAVDIHMPAAGIVDIVKNSNHSRIPVYSGSPDNIIGIMHIRSFLKEYLKNPKLNIRRVLSAPYYVSPDDRIDGLLTLMSREKHYMALVGKPGQLLGLVTIEDFLEEIVGEIWDEDDIVDSSFIKLGGNRFLVSTGLTVGDAFRRMGIRCHDRRLACESVMTWVSELFGHFPEEDESCIFRDIEISVEDIEDNVIDPANQRLDTVVLRLLPGTSGQSGQKEEMSP